MFLRSKLECRVHRFSRLHFKGAAAKKKRKRGSGGCLLFGGVRVAHQNSTILAYCLWRVNNINFSTWATSSGVHLIYMQFCVELCTSHCWYSYVQCSSSLVFNLEFVCAYTMFNSENVMLKCLHFENGHESPIVVLSKGIIALNVMECDSRKRRRFGFLLFSNARSAKPRIVQDGGICWNQGRRYSKQRRRVCKIC